MERMKNEYEADEEDTDKKLKGKAAKKTIKKSVNNHISADDIEFDDPEYVEYFRKKDINAKRKLEAEENENESKPNGETVKQLSDEDDEDDQEGDEEEGSNEEEEESENGVPAKDGTDRDEWPTLLESSLTKLKKGSIDMKSFEKLFDSILVKLDPSKDEKNKQRLCSLVQALIESYKKECMVAKELNKDLLNFLIKYIYELTYKYGNKSTRQEPSPFIAVFKSLLNSINKEFENEKLNEHRFPQLDKVMSCSAHRTRF